MPSLWSLLLQQKNLAKKGKVIQTSTLPKFALDKYNVNKYTIIFKTITSQREAPLGIAVDGCICGEMIRTMERLAILPKFISDLSSARQCVIIQAIVLGG